MYYWFLPCNIPMYWGLWCLIVYMCITELEQSTPPCSRKSWSHTDNISYFRSWKTVGNSTKKKHDPIPEVRKQKNTKLTTCSGQSKFLNSFSIKSAIAFMYPSRWYHEGITVCCMLTKYSSSLMNQLSTFVRDQLILYYLFGLSYHSMDSER